jgi:hypothetical protein
MREILLQRESLCESGVCVTVTPLLPSVSNASNPALLSLRLTLQLRNNRGLRDLFLVSHPVHHARSSVGVACNCVQSNTLCAQLRTRSHDRAHQVRHDHVWDE